MIDFYRAELPQSGRLAWFRSRLELCKTAGRRPGEPSRRAKWSARPECAVIAWKSNVEIPRLSNNRRDKIPYSMGSF